MDLGSGLGSGLVLQDDTQVPICRWNVYSTDSTYFKLGTYVGMLG